MTLADNFLMLKLFYYYVCQVYGHIVLVIVCLYGRVFNQQNLNWFIELRLSDPRKNGATPIMISCLIDSLGHTNKITGSRPSAIQVMNGLRSETLANRQHCFDLKYKIISKPPPKIPQ